MKKVWTLFFWLFCCSVMAQSAVQDGFFDPVRDPVAAMRNGKLWLIVSDEVLVRSVAKNFSRLGAIEEVDRLQLEDTWYLVLKSRHAQDIEQSVFVAVRLKPDGKGNYFADAYWTACTGEGCSNCSYSGQRNGCYCLFDKPGEPGTPGACYQTFSDEPLLTKVPWKAPN